MAENKKSFVAYCDWGDIFDELNNEEAGKLVKHLFDYVRDKNPTPEDKLTKMMFIQIQQSLKRDLIKYEKYIDKQKVNGLKGGRPKKNPTLLEKTQPFIEKPKKADSVNVSVNDIDNEIKQSLFSLWLNYRKDIKKPIKSESTLTTLIKRFNKEELSVIDKVVNNSIENGWTGLFWDKAVKEKKKSSKSATSNLSF